MLLISNTISCECNNFKEKTHMLLIKNGYIKPIVGEDIHNGCVLIGDDAKIL